MGLVKIGVLVTVFGLGGVAAYIAAKDAYQGAGPLAAEKTVEIPKGASLDGIANRLAQEEVIVHPLLFKAAAKLRGDDSSLQAGDYAFSAGVSMERVLDALARGQAVEHRVTVAEGLTTAEVLRLVSASPVLEGEIVETPPEGTLAPETYFVRRGETRAAVVARMRAAQETVLAEAWAARAEDLPLTSPAEALILASIIEKETGVAGERREVASVFINRLRKGMRLETDPTVIYGITRGSGPLGRELTRKDVRTPSDYNTYTIDGLPPTPIANPGKASIEAALNPATTDYLFFVADGTGGHAFSKTYDEHLRNVRNWRKIRAEQRSSGG